MNTNTPFFRGALTVAAIWIAIWGYLSFNNYQSEMEELERSQYSTPDYLTEGCYNYRTAFGGFREEVHEGTAACLDNARRLHNRSIASSEDFVVERTWKDFLLKGLLPAAILLLLVAFWNGLIGNARLAGSSYLNWLRFGSPGLCPP